MRRKSLRQKDKYDIVKSVKYIPKDIYSKVGYIFFLSSLLLLPPRIPMCICFLILRSSISRLRNDLFRMASKLLPFILLPRILPYSLLFLFTIFSCHLCVFISIFFSSSISSLWRNDITIPFASIKNLSTILYAFENEKKKYGRKRDEDESKKKYTRTSLVSYRGEEKYKFVCS